MKKLVLIFVVIFTFGSVAEAGFDDLLKDVLVESSNQALGTSDYVFVPGDPVIQKDNYAVYYSGSEMTGGTKTLLLTLVNSQGSILLKYPAPNIIQVKTFKLKVVTFDNEGLSVRVLQKG